MTDAYEFRIAGQLSADLLASFEPQEWRDEGGDTVFIRRVEDSSELFGVISRCELLGLRLVGLRQLGDPATASRSHPA